MEVKFFLHCISLWKAHSCMTEENAIEQRNEISLKIVNCFLDSVINENEIL